MSKDPSNRPYVDRAAVSDASLQHVHDRLLHDRPEPREGYLPIPILIVFLFGALFFFAAVYAANFSGSFAALAYDPRYRPADTVPTPAPVDMLAVGRRLYNTNCAMCHQENGTGLPGVFPPLAGAEWVVGAQEVPVGVILHGLTGPIEVLGNQYFGTMPGFAAMWNDANVAAVATYIRQSWGNEAPEVTPETVAEVRQATAGRTAPLTGEEAWALAP